MSTHALSVLDGTVRVGTLNYESLEEQFSFAYDRRWLDQQDSFSISPHILQSGPPAPSSTVRRFLENLLPEGRALDIVSNANQVSKNNLYGLIRALGQETSGALSFYPADAVPTSISTSKREITPSELAQRIYERAEMPFMIWDGRVRMSIAGYQDKLAVYLDGERMYLVEGELASTHILKPEPSEGRLPMLVANEHFCMSLAHRLGLGTAPTSILRLPDPVLLIERFDRVREHNAVKRLHIVDACQALNFPVSYKYERNFGAGRDVRDIREGVSFHRLFSLAEYSVQKAATRLALLRWALFNYLIGNCDAHGKNISFFCRHDGLWLAPFYDLVSVVQFDGLDHELAMAYGDEFLLGEISAFQWADFAQSTGTPRALLAREMRRISKAAIAAAPELAADSSFVGEERALTRRICAFVAEQANKLADAAQPMLKVESKWL
ncbi:MAG TPA: HipA domain-containing protein [Steroidobacteraceae bacterium]|nr:HipA domain-containing protein [Steroidobacteraceae bacterium]